MSKSPTETHSTTKRTPEPNRRSLCNCGPVAQSATSESTRANTPTCDQEIVRTSYWGLAEATGRQVQRHKRISVGRHQTSVTSRSILKMLHWNVTAKPLAAFGETPFPICISSNQEHCYRTRCWSIVRTAVIIHLGTAAQANPHAESSSDIGGDGGNQKKNTA